MRSLPPVRFVVAALVILVSDIVTKAIVYRTLPLGGPPIEVWGDWLRWTYIHNAGAAFGLFQGNRYFFIAVSLVSALVILYLAASRRYRDRWTPIALGMILGGAIGNLIDRIWLGVVIDFIDVGVGSSRWPFFNIADSGISVGVTLLAIRLLFEDRSSTEEADRDEGVLAPDGLEAGEPPASATEEGERRG